MAIERPDLTSATPEIVAYIEALEATLTERTSRRSSENRPEPELEPSEPPTSMNVISISARGIAKRTARHHFTRQRRGGMGVFDIDLDGDDPPRFVVVADASAGIVLVTNHARAFRIAVDKIPEREVRSRGESLLADLPMRPDEELALAFADSGGSYLILVTARGQTRRISGHYFGNSLQPGTVLYDLKEGGAPAAAAWSSGSDEIVIATRSGRGIRFAERLVPVRGCLGIRVDPKDVVVGVAATKAHGGVFLLNDEGKGTIRLMDGFSANKSPGAGGKVAMKTDALIAVAGVDRVAEQVDIFILSKLGKMIRFQASEIPAKEGVVQGVNCMSLRADLCMASTVTTVAS